jgi:hypothetical protein
MKFAYVTNDIDETSIKNHLHHYTTLRETVTCDIDSVTGDCILHR